MEGQQRRRTKGATRREVNAGSGTTPNGWHTSQSAPSGPAQASLMTQKGEGTNRGRNAN